MEIEIKHEGFDVNTKRKFLSFSLSRDMSRKFLDNLNSMLEEEEESDKGKAKKRKNRNSDLGKLLNNNHKLRKLVISFFSDKARILKKEIEKNQSGLGGQEGDS